MTRIDALVVEELGRLTSTSRHSLPCDDFNTPVLRLAHVRISGHEQVGIAETLIGDRTLGHAVLGKFGGQRLRPAYR